MKRLRKQIEPVVLFFSFLILLQSCVVYQGKDVTLEQAAQEESKVKVKTKSSKIYNFRHIGFEDGTFFGVQKKGKELIKVPLEINELSQVRLHNKPLSAVLSICIPVILVGSFALLIASSISFSPGMSWGGSS